MNDSCCVIEKRLWKLLLPAIYNKSFEELISQKPIMTPRTSLLCDQVLAVCSQTYISNLLPLLFSCCLWSSGQLSKNETQISRSRVMICGPGRAGKSSLIDSLRNKPMSKTKDSTPGVSLSKATCHITEEDGRCDWPKETDDRTHQKLFLEESLSSASESASPVSPNSNNGQAQGTADQDSRQQPATSRSNASGKKQGTRSQRSEHRTLQEASRQLYTTRKQQSKVRRRQRRRQKIHFLDLWDFGGQQAYAFLHHMLLSDSRCQYLVAFNGAIPMDAIVPPETFGIDGVEHAVVDLRGQLTYGEVVISWLDVIYQIVGTRGCVRLVGTHLDKVSWTIETPSFMNLMKFAVKHWIWSCKLLVFVFFSVKLSKITPASMPLECCMCV